jgi:hypothetical protein
MACAICSALPSVAMTRSKYRARSCAAWPFPVAQSQTTVWRGASVAMNSYSASG